MCRCHLYVLPYVLRHSTANNLLYWQMRKTILFLFNFLTLTGSFQMLMGGFYFFLTPNSELSNDIWGFLYQECSTRATITILLSTFPSTPTLPHPSAAIRTSWFTGKQRILLKTVLGFRNKEPKRLFEANMLAETFVLNRHRITNGNWLTGIMNSDALALESL